MELRIRSSFRLAFDAITRGIDHEQDQATLQQQQFCGMQPQCGGLADMRCHDHAGETENAAENQRDRERFVLPLHGGPPVFTPATRKRQADVRVALRELLERGKAAGELREDLTPEDLIVATSLLSRPLAGTGDWERSSRGRSWTCRRSSATPPSPRRWSA